MPNNKAFLANLQVLRFLAATSVLFGHIQTEAVDLQIANPGFPVLAVPWGAGVDIFFVISGFIMYLMAEKKFGNSGYSKQFLARRIVRVVPTYWIFTTLMIAATLAFQSRVAHTQIDPVHLLLSYVFVPWPSPSGDIYPILRLGWTLNFEMLFYVVFALALLKSKRVGLTAMVLVFTILALINNFIPDSRWMLKFWSRPIILEFLFGIGLAHLYLKGVRLNARAGWLIAAFGFVFLIASQIGGWTESVTRPVSVGLPALIICSGMALIDDKNVSNSPLRRLLVFGGDASYALYLSHPFSINLVAILWAKLSLHNPWAFVAVASICSILASMVIYRFVEMPLLAIGRRPFEGSAVPGRAKAAHAAAAASS